MHIEEDSLQLLLHNRSKLSNLVKCIKQPKHKWHRQLLMASMDPYRASTQLQRRGEGSAHPGCCHGGPCGGAWHRPFRGPFLPCRVQTWLLGLLRAWDLLKSFEEMEDFDEFGRAGSFYSRAVGTKPLERLAKRVQDSWLLIGSEFISEPECWKWMTHFSFRKILILH